MRDAYFSVVSPTRSLCSFLPDFCNVCQISRLEGRGGEGGRKKGFYLKPGIRAFLVQLLWDTFTHTFPN